MHEVPQQAGGPEVPESRHTRTQSQVPGARWVSNRGLYGCLGMKICTWVGGGVGGSEVCGSVCVYVEVCACVCVCGSVCVCEEVCMQTDVEICELFCRQLREASEQAFENRNEDELTYVLGKVKVADRQLAENIRQMIGQLGSRR